MVTGEIKILAMVSNFLSESSHKQTNNRVFFLQCSIKHNTNGDSLLFVAQYYERITNTP